MSADRYAATITRGRDGTINIRVARGDPAPAADETLIEILYGDDEDELKERAIRFARKNA
jgi:hypothetical protein